MKKFLLSFYLLSIVAFYGYSQSLTLSNHNGPIAPNATIIQSGTPDSVELVTYFNVTNNGANTLRVLCKKVQLTMLDSTEVTMCWAGGCYGSGTNVSPNDQSISTGQTITEFSGHYTQVAFSHFKSGESVVRWVFFDKGNVNDSVSVTVKYTTYPLGLDESMAMQGTLSSIYPNPANSEARCNYSIPAGTDGSFLVRDLLGNTVQTHILNGDSGKLTINTANLNDGVYFCSLLANGKMMQSKKLIVRH
jgi:hypothetical protein